ESRRLLSFALFPFTGWRLPAPTRRGARVAGRRASVLPEEEVRMRQSVLLCALVLVLAAGTSARAQVSGPLFFGGGVDPTKLVFVPIDPRASVVPIAEPQTRATGFSLLNFMPRFLLPSPKPVIGQSTYPSQSQLPGADYLKAFQYRAARPVGN